VHRAILAASIGIVALLQACSAVILSTGTGEETIIHRGTTATELRAVLGEPLMIAELPFPAPLSELSIPERPIVVLVGPYSVVDDSGKRRTVDHKVKVYRKARYQFVGILRQGRDSYNAVSDALMTLGVIEVLAVPAAVVERSTVRTKILTVWFDESDTAVAYKWTTLE
jgi:hypothetical protein